MSTATAQLLAIYVSKAELDLLKHYDFPCSEKVIASAKSTKHGIELRGTRFDLDSLMVPRRTVS